MARQAGESSCTSINLEQNYIAVTVLVQRPVYGMNIALDPYKATRGKFIFLTIVFLAEQTEPIRKRISMQLVH